MRQNQKITVIDSTVTVYNFTVDQEHNYFVGGARVLVHNNDCGQKVAKEVAKNGSAPANRLGNVLHKLYKAHLHNPAKGLYKEYTGLFKKYGIRPDFVDFNTI